MTRTGLAIPLLAGLGGLAAKAAAQDLLWVRQLGTSSYEYHAGVAVDNAGNPYVAGRTEGSLGGLSAGLEDAFLAKYDASGNQLWIRQFGTQEVDWGLGLAVDSVGSAYVTGATRGGLAGPNAGDFDIFLTLYDASGTPLWTRQLGTSVDEQGQGVAVASAGGAYVVGHSSGALGGPVTGGANAVLVRFDGAGNVLWIRRLVTPSSDIGLGVAADSAGNVYLTGFTGGSLAGPSAGAFDVFLARFDASGSLLWTRQFGTAANDFPSGVAVDSTGHAYVAGTTGGGFAGLSAGQDDAFLARYDPSGSQVWIRQFGTPGIDQGNSVAVDSADNAHVSGFTEGGLSGPGAGGGDAFLTRYDAAGNQVWIGQLGTASGDVGRGVAVDSAGNAYLSGLTGGSLGGPGAGQNDAFLAKYGESCYPDCNADGALTVADFGCFQTKFVAADPYADCNQDGQRTVADFGCFQTKFVAGCP